MKKITLSSILITSIILTACGNSTNETAKSETNTSEKISNTNTSQDTTPVLSLLDKYDKFSPTSLVKRDKSSDSRDDAQKSFRINLLPTDEKPKFDNIGISINDCSFGCKYLEGIETFKKQYETPGRTVDSGSVNLEGKSVFFVTNQSSGKDPNTTVYSYFEHDGHFVNVTLNEGYALPESALDKTEARLLANTVVEDLLKQTN